MSFSVLAALFLAVLQLAENSTKLVELLKGQSINR
jgi:hypothetical protein